MLSNANKTVPQARAHPKRFITSLAVGIAWIISQRGHAVANGLPVISVNRVGHEPDPSGQTRGIQFWGSSFVAGPQGEILWQAPSDVESVHTVEVDLSRSEQVRRWWPFLRDRRIDAYDNITRRFID